MAKKIPLPMQHEKVFSQDGHYSFIVEKNVLGHQEAVAHALSALAGWHSTVPTTRSLRLLDLACGGCPVVVAQLMAHFPETEFEYIGVDVNADQVRQVRDRNDYPFNVRSVRIIQENAWLPQSIGLQGQFDIVYSGLSFHHAVPEELYFLAGQLKSFLHPHGVVLNHDLYRPSAAPYLRPPAKHPDRPQEDHFLVPPEVLQGIGMPDYGIPEVRFGEHTTDWRDQFLQKYAEHLRRLGADPEGAADILSHIYCWDFPVSKEEMQRIWTLAGYQVTVSGFDQSDLPFGAYLGFMVAAKKD